MFERTIKLQDFDWLGGPEMEIDAIRVEDGTPYFYAFVCFGSDKGFIDLRFPLNDAPEMLRGWSELFEKAAKVAEDHQLESDDKCSE